MSRNVSTPVCEPGLSPITEELWRLCEIAFFRNRFSQHCQLDFSDEKFQTMQSSSSRNLESEVEQDINLVLHHAAFPFSCADSIPGNLGGTG
jgi:hypothetical protein